MDHPGLAEVVEQILDHRLAGDADLADAAVEGADRQRHPEPSGQELADPGPRDVVAHRQSGDERGQRRADQTRLAQQQVARAPRHGGQHTHAGPGGGDRTAGALRGVMDVTQAMRIPPPTSSRSRTKWALWPRLGSHNSKTVPQIAHAAG
jgi:hypothetical protein